MLKNKNHYVNFEEHLKFEISNDINSNDEDENEDNEQIASINSINLPISPSSLAIDIDTLNVVKLLKSCLQRNILIITTSN
ncbi:15498_t:CDS:2 [Funneliformis mosseae]|uniref:15498_t:CDS:1 n=1 Tax=Funneliformis mosseae TaxID=27381 RepID=A0A9N8VG43_FUNMO|nr:15498_t:CDS:2 [Funneliformis mosseae]